MTGRPAIGLRGTARFAAPFSLCLLLAVGVRAQTSPAPGNGEGGGSIQLRSTPPRSASSPAQTAPTRGRVDDRDWTIRQAQSLARGKKCEEALALLDMLEGGGEDDPIAVKLRGDCLRKLGRFDEAKKIYRRKADAMSASGKDATPMLIELERAIRESNDPGGAFSVCLEIHRIGTAGAWVRDEMEGLIVADSLGARAVSALQEEISRRPEDQDLASLLIGALLFLGKDAEALREAQSLDRLRSAHGKVLLEYLRMMGGKGLGAPAVACADAALGEGLGAEDAQEALVLKAGAQRRMRDLRGAVDSYDRAAKADPKGPLVHVALRERADLLVRDLHDLKAGAAAQEDLITTLTDAGPADRGRLLGQALIDLANTKLRMGLYEDAVSVCKRVEEEAKDEESKGDAAFLQAEVLFYAGKIDEARTAYEQVAREHAGGNRVNDALDRLILLTRAGDAGALPLAALGQIAYQRKFGEPARALTLCQEAEKECSGCPAEEDFLREESLLLLELGRIDEAAVRADTLAARFPDSGASPEVLRAVADGFRARDGEGEAVLRRYEDLLVRFPKSHDAFEVRALLEKIRRTGERAGSGTEGSRG
jgi:tetratricopeptide (TPR) repeat protein